jgi:uncharacterized protein YfaS (alpha-2-macroglobulin family)
MKTMFAWILLVACPISLFAAAAPPADYSLRRAEAEKLFADGSFAKAGEIYRSINFTNLPPAEARWVQFRRADAQWRSEAATQQADATKLEAAREALVNLVRDVKRVEERDRVWVEVQESLGDYWWTRRNQPNWGQAWPYYQPVLEWWAGAVDIELARARYLKVVGRIAQPPGRERYYQYGSFGNVLPLPLLENVLKISPTDNDKAHAHYLIAMTLRQQGGDWEQRARVPEHFESALKTGKTTDWYDDALYNYAEWMLNQGRVIALKDGNWSSQPDYVKALALFRRLVEEFNQGETRYWAQAQAQIKNLTDPQLGLSIGNFFLPDSEIQYHLNWRNLQRIELALYPVDLATAVNLSGQADRRGHWLHSIELGTREKLKSWTRDTNDQGDHVPGNDLRRYDGKLRPGAYIIEARAGNLTARDLILVTDAALVLKTSGKQALIYFCNAINSAPFGGGKVKLWERWHDGKTWQSKQTEKPLSKDGLAVFDLGREAGNGVELFASATSGDKQAFSTGNSYWSRGESEAWRIYAFTDRPAYRPSESVQWKFIARRYNGSVYSTPGNATVEFEITDPRGTKVKADKAKLNVFGSAWGALELTGQMPLGEYNITFWNEGRNQVIGQAVLFRLEEYKLPEFKVVVKTPEAAGTDPVPRRKAFRLGESVEVSIQADYYFGGAVANASVEVLVHQNPFYPTWRPARDYGWFYEDLNESNPYARRGRNFGGGQIIKRETLKTDATGKATLTFDTPRDQGDLDYRIEARVTDASRREIMGSVRVTRQRYYVTAQPEHNIYQPLDQARVAFKALDANGQPVQVEGTAKVTREYWYEIWLDPAGKEVKGEALKAMQGKGAFPPAPKPGELPWRVKFRGYQRDEILTQKVKTDAEGKGELSFTPQREGYYRVAWLSEDMIPNRPPQPIRAETTVWVANNATSELGYRHGGVQLIVDQETFRVGQKAAVMISVPANDRYVLFSIEGEDLYSYQLVHVTGTAKRVEVDITEQHVPNIFLSATLVQDRQIFTDMKQVIVPPAKNFLTIDVNSDHPQYQPREEGIFTITTRDHQGKPVPAEVAFSLVDESVYYIQSDYAGDPRQFFFGTKRGHQIQTQSTMNQKSYAKLIEWENEQLIDERDKERLERQKRAARGEEFEALQERQGANYFGLSKDRGGVALAMADEAAPRAMSAMAQAGGAPAPMVAESRAMNRLAAKQADKRSSDEPSQTGEGPAVTVRSDFRSTILWQPEVATDKNGQATVKVKYPDSLTRWKATARVVGAGNTFGIADATTRTKQPLIVRLQAPRFFVVGDEVVLSAVVNNNTDQPMEVKVALDISGGLDVLGSARVSRASVGVAPTGTNAAGRPKSSEAPSKDERARTSELSAGRRQQPAGGGRYPEIALTIPAQSETRVDWSAVVEAPGEVKLKVTGRGGKYSDAMEKSYVAYEHGIEKFIAKSGKVRGNDITVKLDLPKARRADSTSLVVQVTPSMAVTMLDALPYLIEYPYGCTEQTMSRFLPAAITVKTLRDLGLQPEDVMSRVFGGIETNAAAATQPKGKKDLAELDKMVKAGLERLYDFQHGDGGWGWWKEGESDRWMTAYVVWGLTLAKQAGLELKANVTERGAGFLDKSLVEEELNPDLQAWMLHALAANHAATKWAALSPFQTKAFDSLWTHREQLNAYTRALFALAAHHFGKADQAKTLIANLENGVKRDERPDASVLISPSPIANAPSPAALGTAHWGEDGVYWRWSDGGVEATAFALRALLTIDPKHKLIEPVANWLIKNRRGAQWSNTRDTAIVVLALNDYLRVSGELKSELDYELTVNGHRVAKRHVTGADVFNAPSRFVVDRKFLQDGANEIRIQRKGEGSIYFAAEAKYFSLEEPVTPAGNELFVKREYYKLVGRPTLLKGFVYDKVPLADGEAVKSGERVETVLTIETKNNYEYLLLEDLKPAGIEAVAIRSGESLYARELKSGAVERKFNPVPPASKAAAAGAKLAATGRLPVPQTAIEDADHTGRSRWVYQELRDRKVALFLDKLPEGVWEIRYDFRAEVPGIFHALPVLGHAMYVPEIRANSAEIRVKVEDPKP